MATASMISQVTVPVAVVVGTGKSPKRLTRVKHISGLNSFGGLKAQNNVVSLGAPVSTEQSFAKIVGSLRQQPLQGKGGGSLSSTCDAVGEIFRIAAIIPGLVLVGVAVGFVLLRLEAIVEEE